MKGILSASVLLLLLCCCGGPRQETPENTRPSPATSTPTHPPVVLISIDTLRSDHLPAYGYAGVETPAIDALRRDSILFERAYSHTPLTLPSHVSILTGQLPGVHGVRDNQGYAFDSTKIGFLPSELKRLGYATAAAVSAYVMRGDSGLGGGFDVYEDAIALRDGTALGGISRPGEVTLAAIEPWLRSAPEPLLLLFHLFEPHMPYDPPDPERYASPYDGEIAAADRVVGRLLDLLRQLDLYDRALIVLLSDHGEGLGDHGEGEHGILLYREALQVPLLIKLPAAQRAGFAHRAGSSVGTPVQLIDVYPTILDAVGAPVSRDLPGRSLLSLADAAPRRIYAETFYPRLHYGWSDLASIIEGDFHFIDGPDPELYDLGADPGETRNVLLAEKRRAAELRRHLAGFDRTLEPPAAVDASTREKLAALGYLGGAASEAEGPLPDPKARLPTLDDLRRASEHKMQGDLASAVPLYRKALAANPGMLDGWLTLGDALRGLGRWQEAVEAYSRAFEISGGDPDLGLQVAAGYERLGLLHLERRAWEAARDASQRALDLDPARSEAWNNLGVARYHLGERRLALDAWERAVELDPGKLDTLYNLGTRAAELGRQEQARKALAGFIERAPPERYPAELRQARVLLQRLED